MTALDPYRTSNGHVGTRNRLVAPSFYEVEMGPWIDARSSLVAFSSAMMPDSCSVPDRSLSGEARDAEHRASDNETHVGPAASRLPGLDDSSIKGTRHTGIAACDQALGGAGHSNPLSAGGRSRLSFVASALTQTRASTQARSSSRDRRGIGLECWFLRARAPSSSLSPTQDVPAGLRGTQRVPGRLEDHWGPSTFSMLPGLAICTLRRVPLQDPARRRLTLTRGREAITIMGAQRELQYDLLVLFARRDGNNHAARKTFSSLSSPSRATSPQLARMRPGGVAAANGRRRHS
ncbi:hypothetical protein KC340_g120 [Hortaea werneckii]|nr:hypothetical protein KC340_g120 [Hortaea werneckii]